MKRILAITVVIVMVLSAIPVLNEHNKKGFAKAESNTTSFFPTADTSINLFMPDSNYGRLPYLAVASYTELSNREFDTLIKFDLSVIPSGATIRSATLKVYYYNFLAHDPAGRTTSCFRITGSWDEYTVTWNNCPKCDFTPTSGIYVPPNPGWMSWDVIRDVQSFVDGVHTNYGWRIIDEINENELARIPPQQQYKSRENGDPALIPVLEVTFGYQAFGIDWTYPSSGIFEQKLGNPYTIKLTANNPNNAKQDFVYGLKITGYRTLNLLGGDFAPGWNLDESSTCTSPGSVDYPLGSSLKTEIDRRATKTFDFSVTNTWNWIEPWSIDRITDIVWSMLWAIADGLFPELKALSELNNYLGYAQTIAQFVEAVWRVEYSYKGLYDASNKSQGKVTAWVLPEKMALLVESFVAAELASKATTAAAVAAIAPVVGWATALALAAIEAAAWITSEIAYVAAVDPDENFTEFASLNSWRVPALDEIPPGPEKEAAETAFELLSVAEARATSFTRYLGALEAMSDDWATMQLTATEYYTQCQSSLTKQLTSQLDTIISNISAPTPEQIAEIRLNLSLNGLPDFDKKVLQQVGFTEEEIDTLTQSYVIAPDILYANCFRISQTAEDFALMIGTTYELYPKDPNTVMVNLDAYPTTLDTAHLPNLFTCYVEPQNIFDLTGYTFSSALLNGRVAPTSISHSPGDYDADGVQDIKIEFDASSVASILKTGEPLLAIFGSLTTPTSNVIQYSGSGRITVIDHTSPTAQIIKPSEGLFVMNRKILSLPFILIVGSVDVEINASDANSAVARVEFYVDDTIRETITNEPYMWMWAERVFGHYRVKVVVYDSSGNYATNEIKVWKFF